MTLSPALSYKAERALDEWQAMDRLRLAADNTADFDPTYVAAHIVPVINGPIHYCDQCGGVGYIANTWDNSSSSHACYSCGTKGVTTFPAYSARIYTQAHPQVAHVGFGDFSDDEYADYMNTRYGKHVSDSI